MIKRYNVKLTRNQIDRCINNCIAYKRTVYNDRFYEKQHNNKLLKVFVELLKRISKED